MRRSTARPELLDGPLDDPLALRANLRDLRRINRLLGGTRLSAAALDALVGGAWRGSPVSAREVPDAEGLQPVPQISLLDVGTGGADIPLALIDRSTDPGPGPMLSGRQRDPRLRVTGIDERTEILDAARLVDTRLAIAEASGALTLAIADGRSLPYDDQAFDVAHCSLVVHHLAPDAAVAMFREMARVTRRGIIVNDLLRGRLALIGAWCLTRLATGNRYTRHDAPLSVRRAYTKPELRAMVKDAGLTIAWEADGLLGHRWAVAARLGP